MKSKKSDLIFIVCFMAVCLVPLVLMPFFGNQKPVGNEPEPVRPQIKTDDGKFNKKVMSDAGEFFSKKFAFRQQLINTGDLIKGKVFGVSAQSGVIMGRDGWLFYSNTFEDFQGISTLSDYRIDSSVYNLDLISKRLNRKGIDFAFTIAPNKSSLYPEKMRSGYRINKHGRNSSRLRKALKNSDVRYIDLYHLFERKKEILYHKTDSHWNNKGAAMVSSYLKKEMNDDHTDWSDEEYKIRHDFQGDLAAMIYPLATDHDKEIYYDRKFTFEYTGESKAFLDDPENDKKDVTDQSVVETRNKGKKGSIVMLRDSFGISLVPFIAEDYGKGYYLNKSPYYFQPAVERNADEVIFELVERNLANLTTDAPELDMGKLKIDTSDLKEEEYKGTAKAEMSTSGNEFNKIYGKLDPEKTKKGMKVYVSLTPSEGGGEYITPAFRTTRYAQKSDKDKDYGYAAYLSWNSIDPGEYKVRLIYGKNKKSLGITKVLGEVSM